MWSRGESMESRCRCSRARIEQLSSGQLHLNFQIPSTIRKSLPSRGGIVLWWSRRDLIESLSGSVQPSPAALTRAAFKLFDSPLLFPPKKKPPFGVVFSLVEPRGIEPLSESNLERISPGAVCYLHSLFPAGANTLRESVAS